MHRVRGHRAPLHVDQLQQFRQRRNLVRLAVHLDLRQGQLRLRRERLQQVRRRPLRCLLERLPQHLAVHRHHLAETIRPVLRQAQQRLLQAGRGQQLEHPRERVVARNPVLQRHELPQPGLAGASVVLHVDARAPAREHRQQRDRQQLVEVVALGVAAPRVFNFLKNRQNLLHPLSPSLDRKVDSALSSTASQLPHVQMQSPCCPTLCGYPCCERRPRSVRVYTSQGGLRLRVLGVRPAAAWRTHDGNQRHLRRLGSARSGCGVCGRETGLCRMAATPPCRAGTAVARDPLWMKR